MRLNEQLCDSLDAIGAVAEDSGAGDAVAITLLSDKHLRLTLLRLALSAVRTAPDRPDRQLAAELAGALTDSAALQHACRVLLLLAPRAPALASSYVLRRAATSVGMALADAHHLADVCADQDPASATLLYGVTSDRCVQTAVLAMGLAELCTADGGPAYGIPPELLRDLTALFGSGGSGGGGGSGKGGRRPPPGRRASLSIALRVMRLAVASAEAETETEGGPAARGAGSGRLDDPASEPPPSLAAALAGGVLPLTEMLLRRAVWEHVPAAITRGLLGGGTFAANAFLAPLLAYGEPRQAAALVATVGKVLALTDPRVVTAAAWEPQEDTQQCIVDAACDLLSWGLRWWEETAANDAAAAAAAGPSAALPLQQRLARVLSCAACTWLSVLLRLASSTVQALAPAAKECSCGSSPPPDSETSAAGAFTLLGAVLPWLPLLARTQELRTATTGSGAANRRGAGNGDVGSGGNTGGGGGGNGGSSSGGDGGRCDGNRDGGWRELIETCAPALRSLGCSLRLAAAAPPGGVPVGALRGLVEACRLVESWPHEPWATDADGTPLLASWPPGALGAVAEQLRAADSLDPAATAERLEGSLTRRRPGTAAVTSADR
ncbi:hypothetical protein GPECTOR_69g441 [Gonium pectorale]|uniref:Uncharacterized protein n=1 Tax=Gonium pectorale TaxID=33097 RepID=A0A150G3C8_GONPE|nr:hypothetical protein GPECTOR_69g441 [Gonium pectorale]|eukprot:KXZ44348.1 hypothetical protein GPECTOR_69g441 [Gonium pectorale]